MIKIRLIQGYVVHKPGTELTLGRGQAELLISRGVAVFVETVEAPGNSEVKTRHKKAAPRNRAMRGPGR